MNMRKLWRARARLKMRARLRECYFWGSHIAYMHPALDYHPTYQHRAEIAAYYRGRRAEMRALRKMSEEGVAIEIEGLLLRIRK